MTKRSLFDLSHEHKMTGKFGLLYPCMLTEVMPGDKFYCRSDVVLRMMPLIAPVMHRVDCFVHYFFVPTRLIWKNFDKFLTGGDKGTDTVVAPYMAMPPVGANPARPFFSWNAVGSLADYFGLPVNGGVGNPMALKCSALPFRAYALIFNEWYRNQNITDPVGFSDSDGADYTTNYNLLRRCWQRGYFTDALPWEQKGDPVSIMSGRQTVYADEAKATRLNFGKGTSGDNQDAVKMGTVSGGSSMATSSTGNLTALGVFGANSGGSGNSSFDTHLYTQGAITTVNELRLAIQVQRFLEKNALGGSRMIEFLLSHFGIVSSDARLQRPEYLGGGRCPIVIGDVMQTSSSDDTSPQGNMAGHGYGAMSAPGFHRFFEEFGYVIGILSAMPKPEYMQGMAKLWKRFSRYDYPLPVFAHLGEQPILESEIWYQNASSVTDSIDETLENKEVFGFVPRYEEMRRVPSQVHGQFRTTLDFWHLARKFDSKPTLSNEFIQCTPSERIFATQDDSDHLVIQILHNCKVKRCLPKFGTPSSL